METIIQFVLEDWTGVIVQLFFIGTILLMIIDKQKPPITTAILTGFALIVLAVGGSYSSNAVAVVAFFSGLMWLYLAWQRYKQPKQLNKNANPTN